MKMNKKMLIVLIIAIGVMMILPVQKTLAYENFVEDDSIKIASVGSTVGSITPTTATATTNAAGLKTTIAKLLGFLQVASGLISVVVIAFTGFQYIISETPSMKEELKKKMLPVIIGLICVFGAVSIAQFILAAVE